MAGSSGAEFIRIRRRDLERLTTEVMQMKDFLPKILNPELVEIVQRLEQAETALEKKTLDCDHLMARLEAAQSECVRERQEKLSLVSQVSSLREQSVQQAEYCSHMGAAACTLLWGVSHKEEVVLSILGGSKAPMFFSLAAQTLSSFVRSLTSEQPQDEENEESHFVLGLAGTVTNVAAVSSGREFLVSRCQDLLETWIQLLEEIGLGSCCRLRVLLLMSLYNVSINQKGLSWMSNNHKLISQVQRLLTDPDPEVCLHALRLFQSVVLEPEVLPRLKADLQESVGHIVALSQSRNRQLQSEACELLEEVKVLQADA
ncbi:hypothetical protein XENTR_v10004642 [Xenopus tropicalis]|uniref:Heat shock factor 2-binding protein n=1 Tax=Xenopus tropicalis TaxID=8364 RepID=F6R0G5_XENTR|nr:heat shock factor 2-binding protein [Xenopus tropicalis]KAE8620990.1 hypothetical protein XENTR_v10004642 [Xenopus tropicalis]|eukprot:XP_002942771.2 PREDICTED: heat shock factor 2-binding protein [Xenopus tropicalis]